MAVTPPQEDLDTATFNGNLEAIEQHIAAGTDLNEKLGEDGHTALITATTLDHVDIVKALITGGADINQRTNDGSTPLITAAFLCRQAVVEALLDAGADKTLRSNAGTTALESVQAPWVFVKPIYEFLDNALAPAGVSLDFERIKADRPKIAQLLQ